MKILLDTQVFIWLVTDDPQLGATSKKLILDTQNQVFISFMSFFEITIKASLGKLNFDPAVMQDLDKMHVQLISGDYQSLAKYRVFSQKNKDPFDNFLMATAQAHELTFFTSDTKILKSKAEGVVVTDVRE